VFVVDLLISSQPLRWLAGMWVGELALRATGGGLCPTSAFSSQKIGIPKLHTIQNAYC